MSVDHSREQDPVEQLLLTAYPNPERKGCPGPKILAELANKERDPKDENWYHVWHCSPCYAEFKELRDARWQRERFRAQTVSRRSWVAAAGVAVLAGTTGLVWFTHEHNRPAAVEVASVTLDLSNVDASRGLGQDHTVRLNPLPRKMDEVRIILPRFSDDGQYTIAVLRSKAADSAVAVAEAPAVQRGRDLGVWVRLDLSKVAPGEYLLGTRHRGGDQIYYYPLQVR